MPFDTLPDTFSSILTPSGSDTVALTQPDYFIDLNLDQIVDAATADGDPAVLRPIFWTRTRDEETVRYRQAVFADLERPAMFALLAPFRDEMRQVRANLDYAGKADRSAHHDMVMLRAAGLYVAAVHGLADGLRGNTPRSTGLLACLRYLEASMAAPGFMALEAGVGRCRAALASIHYGLLFRDDSVQIRPYPAEPDYTDTVHARFARFRETPTDTPRPKASAASFGLDHIEAGILSSVARLFPGPFDTLRTFLAEAGDVVDPVISRLDCEIGFYASYLAFIAPFRRVGLPFCMPSVSTAERDEAIEDGFDLALAAKLHAERGTIVRNDWRLSGAERLLVVTGPNQGGKTTFARAFGQAHHLAAIGCPVPGASATLFLPDAIFTHFERSEAVANLRGKLEDELVALHRTCTAVTADSLVVLNEVFNSTGLDDQVFLGTAVLRRILDAGAFGVCVTFIDGLSALGPATVSLLSDIDPADKAIRTFRIVRRPADGLAYARTLAERRHLTYDQLTCRLRP